MYGEKYPCMIALWCHHSVIMPDFLMPETQQTIIHVHTCTCSYYFDYLLFLLVKGSCRTLPIYCT